MKLNKIGKNLIVLIAMLTIIGVVNAAEVTTDKEDYAPEETVIITGTGFNPGSVTCTITRPDGETESVTAVADENGAFTATYLLDGINGTYLLEATDGVNYASTEFTDVFVCVDPDGGANRYAKATTWCDFSTKTDYCTDGHHVKEYYCDSNFWTVWIASTTLTCPYNHGCYDGYCKDADSSSAHCSGGGWNWDDSGKCCGNDYWADDWCGDNGRCLNGVWSGESCGAGNMCQNGECISVMDPEVIPLLKDIQSKIINIVIPKLHATYEEVIKIEAKLDDETRFTDDKELAAHESDVIAEIAQTERKLVEWALLEKKDLVFIWLDKRDEVKAIVWDTIEKLEVAGYDTKEARKHAEKADAFLGQGEYKKAWKEYCNAYKECATVNKVDNSDS